jgi:hypothetical protein
MITDDNDKLRSLFQEINLEEPSVGFENRLMQQVHHIAAKQSRKKKWLSISAMTGGVLAMLGIPAFIFWLFGISFKADLPFVNTSMPDMKIDPMILSIACVALLLLICDLLIRRRIWDKKHKQ